MGTDFVGNWLFWPVKDRSEKLFSKFQAEIKYKLKKVMFIPCKIYTMDLIFFLLLFVTLQFPNY